MIKKLLSGKKRFTLSECAQGCDCTEKDILQFASEGNINLQANLAYTEGDLYVINDSIDSPKELKPRSWKGYQTLTPNFCEKLLTASCMLSRIVRASGKNWSKELG